jgi:hypothetical protein
MALPIREVLDLIVSHGFVEARGPDVPRTPLLSHEPRFFVLANDKSSGAQVCV